VRTHINQNAMPFLWVVTRGTAVAPLGRAGLLFHASRTQFDVGTSRGAARRRSPCAQTRGGDRSLAVPRCTLHVLVLLALAAFAYAQCTSGWTYYDDAVGTDS
jgi:hypothetical protein